MLYEVITPLCADECLFIDFEVGPVGHAHAQSAEISRRVVERADSDRVIHPLDIGVDQSAANTNFLGIYRVDLGDDKWFRCRDRGRRDDIDLVRCVQIEVQCQQRRSYNFV